MNLYHTNPYQFNRFGEERTLNERLKRIEYLTMQELSHIKIKCAREGVDYFRSMEYQEVFADWLDIDDMLQAAGLTHIHEVNAIAMEDILEERDSVLN